MPDSKRIGVVGIPGKWSTEVLADAVAAATGTRLVIDMADVVLDLESGSLLYEGTNLCEFDGLIVKKISSTYSPDTLDRLEMLRVAEAAGVMVFSPAESMLRLIDRLACTVTLRNGDVPMPATRVTEDVAAAWSAVEAFGDAVFKPLYSTKARGMTVISTADGRDAAMQAIEAFRADNPVMYIQEKLALPGRDLGMVFLGGEYLGSYARVGKGDAWNTTIHSGGHYEAADPPEEVIALASHAQSLFDLDFTTVDVAETEQGAVVFEVSAFGGFRGAKEGMGIDVAERYVAYALECLR